LIVKCKLFLYDFQSVVYNQVGLKVSSSRVSNMIVCSQIIEKSQNHQFLAMGNDVANPLAIEIHHYIHSVLHGLSLQFQLHWQ
jgi:hypothetical protein